jgi:5-methylcytosine-specific restriction protein B
MARKSPVTEFPASPLRTPEKVRALDASALALPPPARRGSSRPRAESLLPDGDPRLLEVRSLLQFGGIIFVGPPGTSKTYYASQIALKLVEGDPTRVRFVQFHPSYQYEDFVEGYIPIPGGGFVQKGKHLVEMCELATSEEGSYCVLVIDELSRVDPGRVFGECLTYIEMTKRGEPFHLASGNKLTIPKNLIFLATMNPMDRGVDEVDAALERRFAKIAMDPDPAMLDKFLTSNGMKSELKTRVLSFFDWLRAHTLPAARIGQTYFLETRNEEDLRRLWKHSLRFHFEKAFRLDEPSFAETQRRWEAIFTETGPTPRPPSPIPTEG